jgi:ABC-2 type transport system permease protein
LALHRAGHIRLLGKRLSPPNSVLRRAVSAPALPLWQVAATVLLLILFVPAVMWLAGKVFRTGILMYGKRPTLREIWRWVRFS